MFVEASDECNTVMFATGAGGASRAWDIMGILKSIPTQPRFFQNLRFPFFPVTQYKCGDEAGGNKEQA